MQVHADIGELNEVRQGRHGCSRERWQCCCYRTAVQRRKREKLVILREGLLFSLSSIGRRDRWYAGLSILTKRSIAATIEKRGKKGGGRGVGAWKKKKKNSSTVLFTRAEKKGRNCVRYNQSNSNVEKATEHETPNGWKTDALVRFIALQYSERGTINDINLWERYWETCWSTFLALHHPSKKVALAGRWTAAVSDQRAPLPSPQKAKGHDRKEIVSLNIAL